VVTATLARSWQLGDLEVITERAIAEMKSKGWLVDEVISSSAKRFRRGRGLRVDWTRTPWPNKEHEVAGSGDAAWVEEGFAEISAEQTSDSSARD
jgi:hypothetical protein